MGVALFVLIAFIAGDDGTAVTWILGGLAIGATVAAAPVGALLSDGTPSTIVALGGGMTVAGAATTPGGNFAGLVMVIAGLALLLTGAVASPAFTWKLVGSVVVYAIALTIGMFAGFVVGPGTVVALVISAGVATSPRWRLRRATPGSQES